MPCDRYTTFAKLVQLVALGDAHEPVRGAHHGADRRRGVVVIGTSEADEGGKQDQDEADEQQHRHPVGRSFGFHHDFLTARQMPYPIRAGICAT